MVFKVKYEPNKVKEKRFSIKSIGSILKRVRVILLKFLQPPDEFIVTGLPFKPFFNSLVSSIKNSTIRTTKSGILIHVSTPIRTIVACDYKYQIRIEQSNKRKKADI